MTDTKTWTGATYDALADLLEAAPADSWDAPSLCEGWQVRHVVAHVTMPARLTIEQFGQEMAAAGGDFNKLSNTVAARDASLPIDAHLGALRSPQLHNWEPPGGGAAGALSHAVIHSLDITLALGTPATAALDARVEVLNQLVASNGELFGVDLTGLQLQATDTEWQFGSGEAFRAESSELVALVSGRTLPDGRALPRS